MLRPGAAFASTKMRSHGRHSPRTGSLRALRAHLRPVRGCTLVARGKPRREPSRRLRQRLHLHARATQPRAGAGDPRLLMQSQEVEQYNSPTPADQPTRGQGNLRPPQALDEKQRSGTPARAGAPARANPQAAEQKIRAESPPSGGPSLLSVPRTRSTSQRPEATQRLARRSVASHASLAGLARLPPIRDDVTLLVCLHRLPSPA